MLIDTSLLSRGVVAMERMATALENIAAALDETDQEEE